MCERNFYALMSKLTEIKQEIKKHEYSIGFEKGFELAGRIVWKNRHLFKE